MLANAKILMNDGMLDVELLENYIVDTLGGVIGSQYEQVVPHVTFTNGEIVESELPNWEDSLTTTPSQEDLSINENPKMQEENTIAMVVALGVVSLIGLLVSKKKRV